MNWTLHLTDRFPHSSRPTNGADSGHSVERTNLNHLASVDLVSAVVLLLWYKGFLGYKGESPFDLLLTVSSCHCLLHSETLWTQWSLPRPSFLSLLPLSLLLPLRINFTLWMAPEEAMFAVTMMVISVATAGIVTFIQPIPTAVIGSIIVVVRLV